MSRVYTIALVVAVVNLMKGRDWGIQVENESGGDITIIILYYLTEKIGSKFPNCLVNNQEHESCRI